MIAVFTVPYGPEAKSTSRPDTLEMATIDGASLFSKYGIDAVTRRTVPIRSTSNDSTQFSGVSGIASALTLLTTISMPPNNFAESSTHLDICLLYTSDAADDLLCVDLGGRRIIK